MMKKWGHASLAGLLYLGMGSAVIGAEAASSTDTTMEDIKTDLESLGGYLGYNITTAATTIANSLFDTTSGIEAFQKNTISLFLSTFPGPTIVPNGTAGPSNSINTLINTIFKSSTASSGTNAHLTDQQITNSTNGKSIYPTDPTSQLIGNLLGTPSHSICSLITSTGDSTKPNTNTIAKTNCQDDPKYQEAIAYNVLGTLPTPDEAYSVTTSLVNQLNSNTLLAPLIYTTTPPDNQSSTATPNEPPKGMVATTQAEEAANFIKYISGDLSPSQKIDSTLYSELRQEASDPKTPTALKLRAISAITNHFISMRSFAAQLSVGTANLYDLYSKRMPQTPAAGGNPTSEAYDEYLMATKRLYNTDPTSSTSKPWVEQINTASPATVQKEIALLLAEMNYQLYLTRQQNERLLLTNTAMLFQISHLVIPSVPQRPQEGAQ